MNNKSIKSRLKKKGVFFLNKWPSKKYLYQNFLGSARANLSPLIVCDKKLSFVVRGSGWLKNELVYLVSAGERLKSVGHLPKHINHILQLAGNKNISGFISMGGGSVGDWTGFLASVFKRGRPVAHIPTTWLAAVDSAHGGKTALNMGKVKNVLGSYVFPKAVFVVKPLLPPPEGLPAEMLKMALIKGGPFYKALLKGEDFYSGAGAVKKSLAVFLWNLLPQAIEAKLQITAEDPYDKDGKRICLNLGHTLGHVLELYFGLSHEEAVRLGLCFAFKWSYSRFGLSPKWRKEMAFFFGEGGVEQKLRALLKSLPTRDLRALLEQDKKKRGEKCMDFIFIRGPGQVFAETVLIRDVVLEVQRLLRAT